MQSLPEGITVQKEGDAILGLDAEGKRVMEFNSETGEWVEPAPAIDQATWISLQTREKRLALFPEILESGSRRGELIGRSGWVAYRDENGMLVEGRHYNGDIISRDETIKIMAETLRLGKTNSMDLISGPRNDGSVTHHMSGFAVNPGVAEWKQVTDERGVVYNLKGNTFATVNPVSGEIEEFFLRFRTYDANMVDLIPALEMDMMDAEATKPGVVYDFLFIESVSSPGWKVSHVSATHRTIGGSEQFEAIREILAEIKAAQKNKTERVITLEDVQRVNLPDGFGVDFHNIEVAWVGY
jgi:hypothetical protein